ncbi:hypothetical protein AwWohl_01880 [Gammaproteobacteria bacterium]|nr:hypothetical protein AwWohl_01880 [Gammaproteobacteria bacterium]
MLSYFSWNGRIGRMRYLAWLFGLFLLCMLIPFPFIVFNAIFFNSASSNLPLLSAVYTIVQAIALICFIVIFSVQRLHDLNRSGWWVLLVFMLFTNLLLGIYMLFFPGSDGNNDHGSSPPANSLGVHILVWITIAMLFIGILLSLLFMYISASSLY